MPLDAKFLEADELGLLVLHARRAKAVRLTSPPTRNLECGCEVTV